MISWKARYIELVNTTVPREIHNEMVEGFKDTIVELRAQNNELFNKLMARNLPEYQTFKDQDDVMTYDTYDPTQDEGLAGEILNETELERDS